MLSLGGLLGVEAPSLTQAAMHSDTPSTSSSTTPPSASTSPPSPDDLSQDTPQEESNKAGPKKRRGRRIALLREVFSSSNEERPELREQVQTSLIQGSRLSETSTEVRQLAGMELKAALSYDLIREAWKTLDVLHAPGWHGLDSTPLRQKFVSTSSESKVVTSALLAVGAMTSLHSSIVGILPSRRTKNPSPDEIVALDLGRRREAACKVLAARSVHVAQMSGVLTRSDKRSAEVSSLLRMVVLFTNRDNPFMVELRDNLRFKQGFQTQSTTERWITSLIASDAFVGIMHRRKLAVSDEELVKFGLKDIKGTEARKRLEQARANGPPMDRQVLQDLRHVGMILMREVVRIHHLPLSSELEPLAVKFDSLYDVLDLLLDLVYRVPAPLHRKTFRYHLLLKVPIILEATLVGQAIKHASARPKSSLARDLMIKAQCRFLNALAHSSYVLHPTAIEQGHPQVTADMWNALDVFPEWDELAIEGAVQNGRGEGPLAGTDFGWSELEQLHNFLKISTATFASSYPREQRIRKAWDEHQLELTKRDVVGRLFGPPRGQEAQAGVEAEALAERMVNRALIDLAV